VSPTGPELAGCPSVEERVGRLESKLTLMTQSGTVRLTSMCARWASPLVAIVRERLTKRADSEVS
jgi:hypothetical protein